MKLANTRALKQRSFCKSFYFDQVLSWHFFAFTPLVLQMDEMGTGRPLGVVNRRESCLRLESHKPFIAVRCDFCDYQSVIKSHVKRHMMLKHTKERPFQCSICSKKFKLKHHLREHAQRHADAKLFQCKVCFKKFSYASTLARHFCSAQR